MQILITDERFLTYNNAKEDKYKMFYIQHYYNYNQIKPMYYKPLLKKKEAIIIRNAGFLFYLLPQLKQYEKN